MICRSLAAIAVLAAVVAPLPARAGSVADFYKGKTIRIVIGTSIGGAYGVFSQLASRHLGRFIPGSPTLVIQAMPAGAGLVALNYLGTAAPRDGTVLTLAHVTIVQESLFNPQARFNAVEFQWIGRLASLAVLGVASQRSGIRTLDDARKRGVIYGAPGLLNVPGQSPLILNRIAGTKFKVISGYSGTGQTFIAMERGEVEMSATSVDTMRALHWGKIRSGELVPIFLQSGRRMPEFPEVPTLLEFGNDEVEKAFLAVFSVTADVGRSLAAPPGVPAERIAALRTAFNAMALDPAFLEDFKKLHIELDLMDGAELQPLVAHAMTMSTETRARARAFYDALFQGLK